MIRIHCTNILPDTSNTAESRAAISLCEQLQSELKQYQHAKGDIYILTNIRIFGQKRNDIDLLMMGFIENLHFKEVMTKNYGKVNDLEIRSFISNIELKSHPSNKVSHEGTDYIVKYGNIRHNASVQCSEAKFSLINHLNDQLGVTPFVTDILWFNGLTKKDIDAMRIGIYDNALHSGFSFKDFVKAILFQINVRNDGAQYYLDAFPNGNNFYKKMIDLFTTKREPKGLTKNKFEIISQSSTEIDRLAQEVGNKLTIVTGRAGTGKTIQLLQLAFRLASEENNKRCLILTYNNALVSDIQRLIDYTPMPSKIDGRTVAIKTIEAFFQMLMRETGVLDKKIVPSQKTYIEEYNKYLKHLHEYVVELCSEYDLQSLKDLPDSPIDWDFILIDEAQDFSDYEKEILFKVYGLKRMIVADGIDQFMRNKDRQAWDRGIHKDMIRRPKEMNLERRQKANLVTFVNAYAEKAGIDWSVRPNHDLPGGEIKIYKGYNTNIHSQLIDCCREAGCENYDILILVPRTMVEYVNGNAHFVNADKYQNAGIKIYDGTNSINRTSYPTKDECRLFQYHSCRGLEGWCVVCDRFDELIKDQLDNCQLSENTLGFDEDLKKWRSTMLWSLMPLTRPVDTLIITLSDPHSKIGKTLKELSEIYCDFMEWNINE